MERLYKYQIIKDWLIEQAAAPASRKAMPSIRQIRKHFGVSLAPVNRALQELEAEGLIERRQGASTMLANHNRTIAKASDNTRKLGSIAVVMPDYPSEVFWTINHALEHQARMLKMDLQTYKFDHTLDMDDAIRFAGTCKQLLGLVIVTGSNSLSQEQLDQLEVFGLPVILLNHDFDYEVLPANVTSFIQNPQFGSDLTVQALYDLGHRYVGMIRNEPLTDHGQKILRNMLKSSRNMGILIDSKAIFTTAIKSWSSSLEAARQLTLQALPTIRELGLTALIYQSTPGALAGCQVLYEAGIVVGHDISVIGGGDYEFARYCSPSLCVFTLDYVQMSKQAIRVLVDKPDDMSQVVSFDPSFIVRNSLHRVSP